MYARNTPNLAFKWIFVSSEPSLEIETFFQQPRDQQDLYYFNQLKNIDTAVPYNRLTHTIWFDMANKEMCLVDRAKM